MSGATRAELNTAEAEYSPIPLTTGPDNDPRGLKRPNVCAHCGHALLARAIVRSSAKGANGSGSLGANGRSLECLHCFLRILHLFCSQLSIGTHAK